MGEPNISLSMRTAGKVEKGDFTPSAGAELEIEYEPLTTKLSIDYSSEDSLGLKIEGDYKMKILGQDLDATADFSFQKDSWKTGESLTMDISKNVSTTISHEYSSKDGNTFVGSLKFTF